MAKSPMCKNCRNCNKNSELGKYKHSSLDPTALVCSPMNKVVDGGFVCYQYKEK